MTDKIQELAPEDVKGTVDHDAPHPWNKLVCSHCTVHTPGDVELVNGVLKWKCGNNSCNLTSLFNGIPVKKIDSIRNNPEYVEYLKTRFSNWDGFDDQNWGSNYDGNFAGKR